MRSTLDLEISSTGNLPLKTYRAFLTESERMLRLVMRQVAYQFSGSVAFEVMCEGSPLRFFASVSAGENVSERDRPDIEELLMRSTYYILREYEGGGHTPLTGATVDALRGMVEDCRLVFLGFSRAIDAETVYAGLRRFSEFLGRHPEGRISLSFAGTTQAMAGIPQPRLSSRASRGGLGSDVTRQDSCWIIPDGVWFEGDAQWTCRFEGQNIRVTFLDRSVVELFQTGELDLLPRRCALQVRMAPVRPGKCTTYAVLECLAVRDDRSGETLDVKSLRRTLFEST